MTVTDDPDAWRQAGFTLLDTPEPLVDLGGIFVAFDAEAPSPISWTFDGLSSDSDDLDGIATMQRPNPYDASEVSNSNGVVHLDHVVMMSPSLPRTVPTLEAAGFEVRRRRDIPQGRQQVFLWAGLSIIELVGVLDADENLSVEEHPSSLWGLAMSTSDIDTAAETLGDLVGGIKDAVQTGRRIATVRTSELGITPTIALLTPHKAE